MENKPYWMQRRDLKLGKKSDAEKKKDEKEEKKAKGVFFANQILKAPSRCEECNNSLAATKAINPTAIVAHIIAKSKTSGCPSVALHPLNKVYLCGDCHTDMDNKGAEHVQKMKVFPVMKERVAAFYDEIEPSERRRVPVYFRPKR